MLRDAPGKLETINDADGFVSNFWRAIQRDPEAVAEHADWIIDECSLHARHLWLVGQRESLTARLCGDDAFFDAKAAGWWAWGLCCWIGSGWCSGRGPWQSVDGEMALVPNNGQGVNRKRPHLRDHGKGVNRQRPHLRNNGQGVNRQRPHLNNGQGVNRQLPHLGNNGQGECAARREWLIGYLRGFADRLRNVRICCGDWSRVCGPSVTWRHGLTGVFLDPPYADTATRTSDLYAVDCEQVAHQVREWAIEQGRNPLMRIVLAGYDGEHAMPRDWRVVEWQAFGGYGLQGDADGTGNVNKTRERLWLSPACRRAEQPSLFGEDDEVLAHAAAIE